MLSFEASAILKYVSADMCKQGPELQRVKLKWYNGTSYELDAIIVPLGLLV